MGISKNKKKQWRKCATEMEDALSRARELQGLDDVAFEVSSSGVTTGPAERKYSTAPRAYIKRPHIRYPPKEVVDIWADDSNVPEISKRRRELIEGISRFKKIVRPLHPGTSYRPLEYDHVDLLQKLQKDHEVKINSLKAAEKKMEVSMDDAAQVVDINEDIVDNEEQASFIKKDAKVKLLTRKEKKKRLHNIAKEKLVNLEKKNVKSNAHFLRNIPQLKKMIVKTLKEEKVRRIHREERTLKRQESKAEVKSLEKVSFLLPSEVPVCLRKLVTEGDVFTDVTERFDEYKFKSDKRKKHKKLTKLIKKTGLVK